MARFDAQEPSSSPRNAVLHGAWGATRRHVGLVLAMGAIEGVALAIVLALSYSWIAVPVALKEASAASPLVVTVAPGASRADAVSLGERLKGLPDVASTALRTREDALAALVASGLPPAADGRNPLPDTWIVKLRADEPHRGAPTFTTQVVATRDAIAALPSVDSVRFDEAWVALLDRCSGFWLRDGVAATVVAIASIVVALGAGALLFGRAMTAADGDDRPRAASLMVIVLSVSLVASGLAYVAVQQVGGRIQTDAPIWLQPILVQTGLTLTIAWVWAALATWLVASVAAFAGSVRR